MRTMVVIVAAALMLAACSSSGRHQAAAGPTRPVDLPPASAVAPDNSTIPGGSWGVVKAPQSGGATNVFAIKTIGIVAGKPGAFKDNLMLTGGGSVDLATGVPYYIAYTYAVLAGVPTDAPLQQVYATRGANDTNNIDTLLVPSDEEHCEPPNDDLELPSTLGVARHGCAVAVAAPGITPTTLVFQGSSGGSSNVRFAIPSA